MNLCVFFDAENYQYSFNVRYTRNPYLLLLNTGSFTHLILNGKRKKDKETVYSIYLLPDSKLYLNGAVFILNSFLLLIIVVIFAKKNKKNKILWLYEPRYYFIHNYINWTYAVFDYRISELRNQANHHFYKQVFLQKKVFMYSGNSLWCFVKDKESGYIADIFKTINRIKLFTT